MKSVAHLLFLLLTLAAFGATPISTPAIGPTSRAVATANVVALGDGFLAVWAEGSPDTVEVRGSRLDRDGNPRDHGFVIAGPIYELLSARVATDGDSAYVVYRDYIQSGVTETRFARVDADGSVARGLDPLPLSTSPLAVAASGGNVLVVLSDGVHQTLTATLLDRNGTLLQSGLTVAQTGQPILSLDVAGANGAFNLVWVDADLRVRTLHVSASDLVAGTVTVPSFVRAATDGAAAAVGVVADTGHLLAWWWETNGASTELRVRPLSSIATPLSATPITLGTFVRLSGIVAAVLADGYRLAFLDHSNAGDPQVVSLRVAFDGSLQSITRAPAPTFNSTVGSLYMAAQSDGRTVAVWIERRYLKFDASAGREVLAAAVGADGSVGPSTILSLGFPPQHTRALVPLTASVGALWTDSAPNDRVTVGRVSSFGKPLDEAGLRLRESLYDQRNSAMATDGTQLFVAWTEGEAYKPQTLYGGWVASGGLLSANVRPLATDAGDSNVAIAWNGSSYVVVYQRYGTNDLVARRFDYLGNAVDPLPIVLTPPRDPAFLADTNPRLSWNGNEYLLLWQRQMYGPPPINILQPPVFANQLFAQRFGAALVSDSAELPLFTATDNGDSADSPDLALSGGLWLASWSDATPRMRYARIDGNGTRLDPVNGRPLAHPSSAALLAPVQDGWMALTGWLPVRLAHVGFDGLATPPIVLPQFIDFAEAFAIGSVPMVAYRKSGADAAYVDVLPQHRRAGR